MEKSMRVFTNEVVVENTTDPTVIFTDNLGSVTSQQVYKITLAGAVDYNTVLTDPTMRFDLELNDTYLTNVITTPDAGFPFYKLEFLLVLKDGGAQVVSTELNSGSSAGGDDNDGATHLHFNKTTIDTNDQSKLAVIAYLSEANADFGITNKLVLVERIA